MEYPPPFQHFVSGQSMATHEGERDNMKRSNIVLFPFMAQGHLIPFSALAHQLQNTLKHCTITLVTTKLNLHNISSNLSPAAPNIRLAEIPFCATVRARHGIPPDVENTDALPSYNLLPNFLEASMSLKPAFRELISGFVASQYGSTHTAPRLCIISDIFFGWTQEIAHEFGAFHTIFCGGSAYGFACFYSLWQNLPHDTTSFGEITMPGFPEASKIHVTQMSEYLRKANGSDKNSVILQKLLSEWENADAIMFNTVEELETNSGLLYFRRKFGRPVWAVGPLFSPQMSKETEIVSRCTKWLDSKPAKSVLYVSFGSQNNISPSQMMDLAMALEGSDKNFIWVVRPPTGFDISGEFDAEKWLPEEFEERLGVSKRGLLVRKWAPQLEILSHKGVSAFMSHCGWNSVLDALSHGVPIIGWPLAADQFYNAKFLEEELGVCVEVARGNSSSASVGHEKIIANIELVMNVEAEKGREITSKACEVKGIFKNAVRDEIGFKGSSLKAMHEFLSSASMM